MSRRLGPQDTAAGGLLKVPPRGSQSVSEGPQLVPSHHLWNMSLLTPRPKMSRRLGPQDTAAGGLLKMPPRGSQSVSEGPQLVPSGAVQVGSHHLWNMSLLTPRPKMSRRLGAQDTTGVPAHAANGAFRSFTTTKNPPGVVPVTLTATFVSDMNDCPMVRAVGVRRKTGMRLF